MLSKVIVPLNIRGRQYYHHLSSKKASSKSSIMLLKEADVLTFEQIYVDPKFHSILYH